MNVNFSSLFLLCFHYSYYSYYFYIYLCYSYILYYFYIIFHYLILLFIITSIVPNYSSFILHYPRAFRIPNPELLIIDRFKDQFLGISIRV